MEATNTSTCSPRSDAEQHENNPQLTNQPAGPPYPSNVEQAAPILPQQSRHIKFTNSASHSCAPTCSLPSCTAQMCRAAKQCCAAMCSDVTAAWGAASDQQTPYSGAAPPQQPHLTRQQAGCLAGPPAVLAQHPQCIALLNTQPIPAGTISSSSITNRVSTRSPCVGGWVPGHQHAAQQVHPPNT